MNLPEPPHCTFTNLTIVDWDSYTREAEESFGLLGLPSSYSTGEPQFRKILNYPVKHHILKVHIPNMIPFLTDITTRLVIERDALHIHELNARIRHNIADSNRQKWTQNVESCLI